MTKATLHKEMSIEDYHAHSEIISKSMLGDFADCPARFKHKYIDNKPEKKTKSLRLGSAVHTLALEPEKWDNEYHVLPSIYYNDKGDEKAFRNDLRIEAVRDEYIAAGYDVDQNDKKQWELSESPKSKLILSINEREQVERMAEAITKNSFAFSLLKAEGYVESSIFFEAEFENAETGEMEAVKMRCRPDFMRNDGVNVDLKMGRSLKPSLFFNDSYNYHYDLSVAITNLGYEKLHGKPADNYVFIGVEPGEPHIVECFESEKPMDELTGLSYAEYGRLHLNHVMSQYLACRQKDSWPGYQTSIGNMEVPQWALRKFVEKGEF